MTRMSKKRIFGVINGMTGQGKSYFVKEYLIPKLKKQKPVVVLDIAGEYEGEIYQNFLEFYEVIKRFGGIPAGVHVVRWTRQETPINLIRFLRHIQKPAVNQTVPVSLILEEAHLLFSQRAVHSKIKSELHDICFLGRHYMMDTILLSQRPAKLTPDIRSQAHFFVSFKQKERADLDYLREKQEAPDNTKQVVANLAKRQFFSIGDQPKGFKEIKINEINEL